MSLDVWQPGGFIALVALLLIIPVYRYDRRSRHWLLGL